MSRHEHATSILKKLQTPLREEQEPEQARESIPEDLVEVLVFQLHEEQYGIPIEQVLEIIRYSEPTEVPHTVVFLEGIISLRGEMIPVINGRKRLKHPPKAPDKKTRIIILQEQNNRYGITVDATNHVIRLSKTNIEQAPAVIDVDAAFIEGVYPHRGKLVILLNLKRFLEFAQ